MWVGAGRCGVARARDERVAVLECLNGVLEGLELRRPVGAADGNVLREAHGPADKGNSEDLNLTNVLKAAREVAREGEDVEE